MKILLDECVTKKIKPLLKDFEVFSVSQMKWNGLKNGKLLAKAVEAGFDLVLTIDKNISSQENISKYNIAVIALDARSSDISDIAPLIPNFLRQINSFRKNRFYIVSNVQ